MKAQAEAIVASLARTFVPAIVGGVLAWLATSGVAIDPSLEGLLQIAFFAGFTGLYYAAVRFVEEKFPWVGILLGYAKSPDSYSKGNLPATAVDEVNPAPSPTVNLYVSSETPTADIVQAAMDRVKDGPDHRL